MSDDVGRLREALERARPYVVDASVGIVTVSPDEADADLRQIDAALAQTTDPIDDRNE